MIACRSARATSSSCSTRGDNRNPEPFGEPFGWDLATTKDFVDYRDCGVAVPRGGDDEQDQFTS